MYKYGRKSNAQRKTCYPLLQLVMRKLLAKHDHAVKQGGRTDKEQWGLFNQTPPRTTLYPPDGQHLMRPDPSGEYDGLWSFAADVIPFINGRPLATDKYNFGPVQKAQFAYFLGILKEIADEVLQDTGWEIRLGINWDRDAEILSDQDFDDWFHIELVWVGL